MRLRLFITAAAVALLAVVPGPAFATTPEGDTPTEDVADMEVVEGPVITSCARPGDSLGLVNGAGDTTAALAGRLRFRASLDECAVRERCRRVDVAKTQRTAARLGIAYRFWHWVYWCYGGERVRIADSGVYVTDVNSTMDYRGVENAYGHHYEWCCGWPQSGYVSFRQGRFENCVVRWGCIGSWYPWVRIRVHRGGTHSSEVGG
jgi:hypothetical protein